VASNVEFFLRLRTSDSNREIRQAADSALSDFLRELSVSAVMECGPIIKILVLQCHNKERLNRLTAVTWVAELIHHPFSGADALLPYHADILRAILWCISDGEKEIRLVAERTNHHLLTLVKDTAAEFELRPLLDTLTTEMVNKADVPTKMACLKWIDMLMEKRKAHMNEHTKDILPVLLRTLSDPNDAVVLLDLQVLSRISLAHGTRGNSQDSTEEAQFKMVLNAILTVFAQDRQLLESRGSLIIRKLCVLLNAKTVYIRMAETLVSYEAGVSDGQQADFETLLFISTMVQTLNLILLSAPELHSLRAILSNSIHRDGRKIATPLATSDRDQSRGHVFATLFHCWAHNPVATLSLCLLAEAYDLSFALVKRFSEMEDITVGFLLQIDKLVHLLESPIFVHLRLQLLDVEAPHHAPLLKSIYGLLMCLPQGEAFRLLNERLQTVCNLRDNLGISDQTNATKSEDRFAIVSSRGLDMTKLLTRFDHVRDLNRKAHDAAAASQQFHDHMEPLAKSNSHSDLAQRRSQQQIMPSSSMMGNNRASPATVSGGGILHGTDPASSPSMSSPALSRTSKNQLPLSPNSSRKW
jgi:vacuole morphology and inheritance protein 14